MDSDAVDGPSGPVGPVGRLIAGRYRLAGLMGVGAMGAVWLARDELLDVDVAVKEIRPPFVVSELFDQETGADGPAGSEDADDASGGWDDSTHAWLARALREARNAARLRGNPHVVTVHDAVVDGGAPWIVMEAVAARSLQEAVEEDGPRPLAEVARIGLAVLDALVAAQALGVVHRDVKPSNILLAYDGRVLLTDFGIAASNSDPTLTQSPDAGPPSGTPAYMAPERLRGGPTTLVADLFALGATLFFAADGESPFHRDTVLASLHAVLFTEPEPERDLGPLAPVIAGLLHKDPAARLRADGAAALLTRALRLLAADPAAAGPVAADPASSVPLALPPAAASAQPAEEPGASPVVPAARAALPVGPGPSASRPTGTSAYASAPATGALPVSAPPSAPPRAAPPLPSTASARPVSLARVDPALFADQAAENAGALSSGRSSRLPIPLGAVAVVGALLLGGLAAWGLGAVRAGDDRSSPPPQAAGTREPGPPGSPTTGASTTAAPPAAPGEVPAGMVGGWHGTVTQGQVTYEVTLDISGGEIDETVGTSHSSQGCRADLVLREAGLKTVIVQEVIRDDNLFCIGAVELQLKLNGDGTLGYYYDQTLINSAGLATLTRTS